MTLYTFPLATPGPGSNGVTARAYQIRYAFAPARDEHGDLVIEGGNLKPAVPVLEIVRNVLATDKGSFAGDPDFGVDYSVVQKATGNVAQAWIAEVKRALKFLVDAKSIINLVVNCDPPTRGQLVYEVVFTDPVSGLIQRPRGRVGV